MEKETDVMSPAWRAGQLKGNDTFSTQIRKQVQGCDLVVTGTSKYPDICQKPYSAESRALRNSSVALMRLCFPRRQTL